MKQFLNIVMYEYRMSTLRWSYWVGLVILTVPYIISMVVPGDNDVALNSLSDQELWRTAGSIVHQLNILLPLLCGILLADRLVRDSRLGTLELIRSTPLSRRRYLLAKYGGVLLSGLSLPLINLFIITLLLPFSGASFVLALKIAGMMLAAFVIIVVPAYAFITIFALACPLVMPIRVYQVLFTGYWFWGNFLNPKKFISLSGTYLRPDGVFALGSIFGSTNSIGAAQYQLSDVLINWIVLAACIVFVFVMLERYLAWRQREA
ncbi:MAG: ABC transporter permease [Anaerolineae bacterium]|nr:ABC transporter permease [Anaerolineae bacterium]